MSCRKVRGCKTARSLSALLLLPVLFLLSSCEFLDALGQNVENPPTVQASALQMTRRPSVTQLAAYYCPTVITDSTLRLLCTVTLGSPPPTSQLAFHFGIHILITNPNNVPVPALDVLLALGQFRYPQLQLGQEQFIDFCTRLRSHGEQLAQSGLVVVGVRAALVQIRHLLPCGHRQLGRNAQFGTTTFDLALGAQAL